MNLLKLQLSLGLRINEIWPIPRPSRTIEAVTEDLLAAILDKAESLQRTPTVQDILKAVCEAANLDISEVCSPSRQRRLGLAPAVAVGIVRETPGLSMIELSRLLNGDPERPTGLGSGPGKRQPTRS